jgi:hypothetical protein
VACFLDFSFSLLLRGARFVRSQAEVSQCAAKAITIRQTSENCISRDVRESRIKVLLQSSGRDVLTKFETGIGGQRCLVSASQIVRIYVQRVCHAWMFTQLSVSLLAVISGEPSAI